MVIGMSRATKEMLARIITHTLFLIMLYICQAMVFSELRILGCSPLIIPLGVVGVALFEGAAWGGGFGLAAGVLCDISFSETIFMFTILMTAIGMGVGLLSEFVLARGFPSYFLCCIAVLLAVAFFQMFPLFVFDKVNWRPISETALIQTLYSMIFIIPVYYFSHRVSRKLRI